MRNIIIQNNIVIEVLEIPCPTIDSFDESVSVVTSDNPNIEIGWLYIDGEFIKN
jgi:hypothetical protein